MSGLTMIIIGLVLGLAGGWSIRTVLMLAGLRRRLAAGERLRREPPGDPGDRARRRLLSPGWWCGSRPPSCSSSVGALVGVLVGARLFRLLEGGDGNLLLAVVFIPAIGIAGGWLAEKTREGFVAWGTSIGGAAMVLAGLGVLVSALEWLRDPSRDLAGRGRRGRLDRPVGVLPVHPEGRGQQGAGG